MFQSLNRAYKRSDEWIERRERCATQVSIPQSGLQAFRRVHCHPPLSRTSLFQSLNRAYKRSDRVLCHTEVIEACKFQSLNRAYKRSDRKISAIGALLRGVSIPQSGLQAFRLHLRSVSCSRLLSFQSLNRAYKRSDDASASVGTPNLLFQSLNRAYKRSDSALLRVEIAASSFQSLNRAYKRSDQWRNLNIRVALSCFNPSIGLTSVPTACRHCL